MVGKMLQDRKKRVDDSLCDGDGKVTEEDRKMRREIANCNERRRMKSINSGFNELRLLLPGNECDKLSKAAILLQTSDMIKILQKDREQLSCQNSKLRLMLEENRQQLSDSLILNADWRSRDNIGVANPLPTQTPQYPTSPWLHDSRVSGDPADSALPHPASPGSQRLHERGEPTPRRVHVKLTRSQVTGGLGKRRKCDTAESSDEGICVEQVYKSAALGLANGRLSSSSPPPPPLPATTSSPTPSAPSAGQPRSESSTTSYFEHHCQADSPVQASITMTPSTIGVTDHRPLVKESATTRSYLNHLVRAICQVEGTRITDDDEEASSPSSPSATADAIPIQTPDVSSREPEAPAVTSATEESAPRTPAPSTPNSRTAASVSSARPTAIDSV